VIHYAKVLQSLCRYSKWPKGAREVVNRMNDVLSVYPQEDGTMHSLCDGLLTTEARSAFAIQIHGIIASMAPSQVLYKLDRVKSELNAAEFLLYVNRGEFIKKDDKNQTNEYKFTSDEGVIKDTIEYYKSQKAILEKQVEKFKRKRI
jgi:hypothetical protein